MIDKRIIEGASNERNAYLLQSNDRLRNKSKSAIQTTMIGALDAIEKTIEDMEDRGLDEKSLLSLDDLFDKVRSKILDIGNNQKRIIDEEFKHYVVDWQRYTTNLPVKERKGN